MFAQGKGPVVPVFTLPRRPSAEHPPLTSIILAPVAKLTRGNLTAMRLTMACLGCIVVLEVGLIAREIAGNRAALIALGLASIYPNLWVNDGLLMSENDHRIGGGVRERSRYSSSRQSRSTRGPADVGPSAESPRSKGDKACSVQGNVTLLERTCGSTWEA